MKAQFLKMAGVNSEDEFYNMFPTEESFFQAYPEARTYANGGSLPEDPPSGGGWYKEKKGAKVFQSGTKDSPPSGEGWIWMDSNPMAEPSTPTNPNAVDNISYDNSFGSNKEYAYGRQGVPLANPNEFSAFNNSPSYDPQPDYPVSQVGPDFMPISMDKFKKPLYFTNPQAFFDQQDGNYANGGTTYPYPGQATADQFFNYGMQGKGAGAQIPVETWFAYGGFTSKPSATLVHYEDGGMGQHSSPFNYGAFPAFAKKGNQVQGGGIDAATGTIKDNFLAAIQKNVNNAMLDQETEQALDMNQQMMPQLIAQYGAEAGSMFIPNMYNQNMFENRYNQLNQESADSTRNMMGLARFFTNNAINRKLDSITEQQKRDKQMELELGTDAQTVPGFNPIPSNMAKYGGSLKKYQTAGATEYKSPAPPISDLDINKIIADTQKAGKTAAQKRKDQEDLAAIQAAKDARDNAVKRYTENPEGDYTVSPSFSGYGASFTRGELAVPNTLINDIKYWDDEYKKLYTAYNAERGIPLYSKSPGELKGSFIESRQYQQPSLFQPFYGTFNPGSSNVYTMPTPAPVAPTPETPAPKAPKTPAKPKATKAPATESKYTKESVRTIYNY